MLSWSQVARLLELPVGGGGGPALEALALQGDPKAIPLPIPMQRKRNFDFSFAGLKTAVRLAVERAPDDLRVSPTFHADVAASFQNVALAHLEQRLKYAMELCASRCEEWGSAPRTLVVSGGVAANKELRRRLQLLCERTQAPNANGSSWELVIPPARLCTDNGVMVAWAAIESLKLGIAHDAEGQQVRARWPLGGSVPGTAVPGSRNPYFSRRKGVDGV